MQLLILAVVAMTLLAIARVISVQRGRTPYFEGMAKLLFVVGFVVVPPFALGVLVQSATDSSPLRGLATIPGYGIALLGVMVAMWIAALVVSAVASGRPRRVLMLGLLGNDNSLDDVPRNPPLTTRLAESVTLVDRANRAFPRGVAFPAEIERSGFRGDWDALAGVTQALEGQIAEDRQLGVGVASVATATAEDARSRLNTLQRLALHSGQAWTG